MHERLKELMEQAQYYDEVFSEGSAGPYIVRKLDAEKFAELIVNECANWIDDATITDSAGNKDYIEDSYFWATELRKHFGVEE